MTPTLLLVHGFPLDHTLWDPQVASLRDVARVLAPDLPGFGTSAAPRTTMTMDDYADALAVTIEEPCVICGLSMGGYVALAFVAKHPDKVRGLILCNTRAGADDEKGREGRRASEKKVQDAGVPELANGMLPKMLTPKAPADLRASVQAMMARQPADGVIAALRGMAARPDRTPMLSSIHVPTLILTGRDDTLIPPSESEAMARAIPGSRLLVIDGAAHLSNLEAPVAFDAAVREFLTTRL
jgi:pimeloyl-ACP methyl ester carboxylesterase